MRISRKVSMALFCWPFLLTCSSFCQADDDIGQLAYTTSSTPGGSQVLVTWCLDKRAASTEAQFVTTSKDGKEAVATKKGIAAGRCSNGYVYAASYVFQKSTLAQQSSLSVKVVEHSASGDIFSSLLAIQDVDSFGSASMGTAAPPCVGWDIPKPTLMVGTSEGTKSKETYSARFQAFKKWRDNGDCNNPLSRLLAINLAPGFDLASQSGKPSIASSRDDGSLQFLSLIRNGTYATTGASVYHNSNLGIYLQQAYGVGLSKLLAKGNFGADLRFIGEHFYGKNKSLSLFGSSIFESYEWDLKNDFVFSQGVTLTPVFNKSNAWQARANFSLTIPFTSKWAFLMQTFDDYIENAPAGYKKNQFSISVGINNRVIHSI